MTKPRALFALLLSLVRRALALRWVRRALLVVLLLLTARMLWIVGHVVYWRNHPVTSTSFMSDREDDGIKIKHRWVDGASISPHLKRAVMAAEDARFRHHYGFDVDGIVMAVEKNATHGKIVMGGSTITQQLAKNLFLSPRRSIVRKLEEACIALSLEILWDKQRILEVYLNVIEWGDGVFGADAAARHYFGVPASQLTPEQGAWLAAIIPSPRRHDRARKAGIVDADVEKKAARIRNQMDALKLP